MSTLKVNAIRGTGASSDAISVNSTDGTCTANLTNPKSFRNLIIGGAMNVAQRGTSSTTSGLQVTDRWHASWNGGGVTQAQVDITSGSPFDAGFRKALKLTNTTGAVAAANYRDIRYTIEAQDIACSGWDSVSTSSNITISFWAKASVAQTYYCFHYVPDSTKHYVWSFALSADTWTKVTKTIPGASGVTINNDNGAGPSIQISLFYGTDYTTSGQALNTWGAWNGSSRTPDMTNTWANTTNSTFEITGVQLEVGDYPSSFEFRSYGDELARCQRYCFVVKADDDDCTGFSGYTSATTHGIFPVRFPVAMRTAPTLSVSGTFRFQSGAYDSATFTSMTIQVPNTSYDGCRIDGSWSAGSLEQDKSGNLQSQANSSSITFSAEL